MTGVIKILIALAFLGAMNVIRYIVNDCLRTSEEKTFHFNLCLCVLLAAWIIRDGLWW